MLMGRGGRAEGSKRHEKILWEGLQAVMKVREAKRQSRYGSLYSRASEGE